jgi:hypothetical protein
MNTVGKLCLELAKTKRNFILKKGRPQPRCNVTTLSELTRIACLSWSKKLQAAKRKLVNSRAAAFALLK